MQTQIETNSIRSFNTLRPGQNGRHFPEDIFNSIFVKENMCILIKSSLSVIPNCQINNIPSFVEIMP